MYRTPRPAYDLACDGNCPAHHSQPRSTYNNPRCHCLATCASQPMTLLAPQIDGALFLDRDDTLWYVPGLQPGHWDWRRAAPVPAGFPLCEAGDRITDLLSEANTGLFPFADRL
ncbi:hypothetical protein [Actinoplanes sp. L3-i22]|uniref:hypothetical protein n=1 Tax=Actinoplanes sp. L3-i22 TaxID=2836373 RepID=UPI001C76478D|nr:hypothetical protein [Actinoplanes sp. L3-i22]BCY07337.1 hypothetical protein L3i22_024250 [Actinoplanes sp. L3-i22]